AYYTGSLPFVLGFLFFWADMSQSAFAYDHCAPAAHQSGRWRPLSERVRNGQTRLRRSTAGPAFEGQRESQGQSEPMRLQREGIRSACEPAAESRRAVR